MWLQCADEPWCAGIMDFSIHDRPFTICQQITEGFWAEKPEVANSKMVRLSPAQIAETGLWIYEGASVMGNYMMGDKQGGLAQRAADGMLVAENEFVIRIDDGNGNNYGGNSVQHYMLGQRHLLQNVLRSKVLPGIVIWSAHERYDDGTKNEGMAKGSAPTKITLGEKKVGPEFIGKALTSVVARDFGNTLHFTTVTKKVAVPGKVDEITGKQLYENKTEYRIYTRDHFDPEGLTQFKYIAVSRSIGDKELPEYVTADTPGGALVKFYNLVGGIVPKKMLKPGVEAPGAKV